MSTKGVLTLFGQKVTIRPVMLPDGPVWGDNLLRASNLLKSGHRQTKFWIPNEFLGFSQTLDT